MKAEKGSHIIRVFVILFFVASIGAGSLFIKYGLGSFIDNPKSDSAEKVTIHFIDWDEIPEQIFTDFSKKYPNIQVEFERYGALQYSKVQISRIEAGDNLDIMGVENNNYSKYVEKGYLEDLTKKKYISYYIPEVVNTLSKMSSDHHVFGISYNSYVLGIWYNKILFNKYNLKVPKNYDEFLHVCASLKKNDISPLVMGCRDELISSYVYYLRILDKAEGKRNWFELIKEGKLKWTDKRLVKSIEEIGAFINKDYILKDSMNLTKEQAFNNFIDGQAAMCLADDRSLNMIDPEIENVCDLGVFPIPYNEKGKTQLVPGVKAGYIIGIYSGSKHKKEANLLLDYLSQRKTAQYYSDEMKAVSTVKGVTYGNLIHNELWEPIRKMKEIPAMEVCFDKSIQEGINESIKELMINAKKPLQIAKELQAIQNKSY